MSKKIPIKEGPLQPERQVSRRSVALRLKPYRALGLLSPGLFFLLLIYSGALLSLFVFSFFRYSASGVEIMQKTFVLENYIRFLGDPFYLKVLWNTFKIAFIVTAICLVMGYPISYFMVRTRSRFGRRVIMMTVFISFLVSVLVRIFSWIIILGQNGLLNNFMVLIGIIDEEHRMQLLGNIYGTIVGLTHILLPFMVLTLVGVLKGIHPSVEEASQNLGANKAQTFLKVTLPLSLPAISAGSLLVFTLAISSFAVPLLLGGPSDRMISNYIYDAFLQFANYPFGAAMSFILLFLTLILVLIQMRVLQTRLLAGG